MSDSEDEDRRANGEETSAIQIRMLKSSGHRVVFADGAFGGVSPRGLIHMALFSERFPLPDVVVHEVVKGERLGDETRREVRGDIVRDVEVSVLMKPDTAVSLAKWLIGKAVAAGADLEAAGVETTVVGEDDEPDERSEGSQ